MGLANDKNNFDRLLQEQKYVIEIRNIILIILIIFFL